MKNKKRFLTKLTERITAKRVIAGALVCAFLITALPGDFISAGVVKAEDEVIDLATSEDVTINYSNFKLKYTANGQTEDFGYDKTTKTYTWPEGVGVAQVTEISGSIAFQFKNMTSNLGPGKCFKIEVPEVLKLKDVSSQSFKKEIGEEGHKVETEIGTYDISNNVITFHITYNNFDVSTWDEMGIGFTATIDPTKLGTAEDNRYALNKNAVSASSYIQIPTIPTEIKNITKTSEVREDNSVLWTITIGSNSESGVTLAGGTLTDVIDGNQVWKKEAYFGDNTEDKVDFSTSDNTTYTYAFPEDSTRTAPQVIHVVTAPKDEAVSVNTSAPSLAS